VALVVSVRGVHEIVAPDPDDINQTNERKTHIPDSIRSAGEDVQGGASRHEHGDEAVVVESFASVGDGQVLADRLPTVP